MSSSGVVAPFLLLCLLCSLARAADSLKERRTLSACRDCVQPRIYSPDWMGVGLVQFTSQPCKWIKCRGNYELWVKGVNMHFDMHKLMCLNGKYRAMQYTNLPNLAAPEDIKEVMCVVPEKTGYYDIHGNWTWKENARCGTRKIYFDIGCNRNEYFTPFENCTEAQIGEDTIACPTGYNMSIMLKTLPTALPISKVVCEGVQWKMYDTNGIVYMQDITEKDSTVYIRCATYIQPEQRTFTEEFIWFGFIVFIVCVGVYRCLIARGHNPKLFFWMKKEDEKVEDAKDATKKTMDQSLEMMQSKDKIE